MISDSIYSSYFELNIALYLVNNTKNIKKTHIHVQCPNPCLARDVGVAGVGSNPRENNSDSRSSFYPEQKLGLVTRLTRGPSPGIMNII